MTERFAEKRPEKGELPPHLSPEEVSALYKGIMKDERGKESALNFLVKFFTDREHLEDWQHMALAPGNFFEDTARFLMKLMSTSGQNEIAAQIADFISKKRSSVSSNPDETQSSIDFSLLLSDFFDQLNLSQKGAVFTKLVTEIIGSQFARSSIPAQLLNLKCKFEMGEDGLENIMASNP